LIRLIIHIQRVVQINFRQLRESAQREPCFLHGAKAGIVIRVEKTGREFGLQAGIGDQQFGNAAPLFEDGELPARSAKIRLIAPFQEMNQEDFKTPGECRRSLRPMASSSSIKCSVSTSAIRPAFSNSLCFWVQP